MTRSMLYIYIYIYIHDVWDEKTARELSDSPQKLRGAMETDAQLPTDTKSEANKGTLTPRINP